MFPVETNNDEPEDKCLRRYFTFHSGLSKAYPEAQEANLSAAVEIVTAPAQREEEKRQGGARHNRGDLPRSFFQARSQCHLQPD